MLISLTKKLEKISTADFIEKNRKKFPLLISLKKNRKKIPLLISLKKIQKKNSTADFIGKKTCDILPHISGETNVSNFT